MNSSMNKSITSTVTQTPFGEGRLMATTHRASDGPDGIWDQLQFRTAIYDGVHVVYRGGDLEVIDVPTELAARRAAGKRRGGRHIA